MKKIATLSIAFSFFLLIFASASSFFPLAAIAQNTPTNTGTQPSAPADASLHIPFKLNNPLKGSTDLQGFIAKVLDAVVLLLTPVVTVMLLYSGFLFVVARGNAEKLGEAKKALMYTLIGAAIVLGAKGFELVIQNTVTCLGGASNC